MVCDPSVICVSPNKIFHHIDCCLHCYLCDAQQLSGLLRCEVPVPVSIVHTHRAGDQHREQRAQAAQAAARYARKILRKALLPADGLDDSEAVLVGEHVPELALDVIQLVVGQAVLVHCDIR